MMVKKINLGTNQPNTKQKETNRSNLKKNWEVEKKNLNFQQELFSSLEEELERKTINTNVIQKKVKTQKPIPKNTIENEIKKIFLGEIVRKDHLYSSTISELQKENILRISFLY